MKVPTVPEPLARFCRNLWELMRDSVYGWIQHDSSRTGAALAFYTVFSLGPILLLAIAIAGLFFGQSAARGEIFDQISAVVGPAGATAVQSVLRHAADRGAGTIATIVSVATLIFGANTALVELKSGLDEIWNVPPERRQGFWYFVRTRLLAVGMILALGFLLLLSLLMSATLAALQDLSKGGHLINLILGWLNSFFQFALVVGLFATIYKVLPSVRIAWRDALIGAVITAMLFHIGKVAIGTYLGSSNLAATYRAAGSLIVVLLWVYYSAQVFLFGAEITRAYACRFGSQHYRCATAPDRPEPA